MTLPSNPYARQNRMRQIQAKFPVKPKIAIHENDLIFDVGQQLKSLHRQKAYWMALCFGLMIVIVISAAVILKSKI